MSNQKVEQTWGRLNEISELIQTHKVAVRVLEQEEDDIHAKCEDDTIRSVLESLNIQGNHDLRDMIMSIKQDDSCPLSQLHELCSEEQWQRWHKLQEVVSETTGMYYDSGMSQSLFVVKIRHDLNK